MAKVTAKFIFRLPFSLKMQEVRGIKPKRMKREGEEIIIYPPVHTKRDMTEKRLRQLETPKPRITQLNKLNCIVIDIRRDFPTIPLVDEDQKALVIEARQILFDILTLCKCRGRQLHITVIDVEHLDYSLRLFDTEGNMIDATGMGYLTLPSLAFKGSDWNNMCQDLINGNKPELYEILLLDARSLAYHNPPYAILNAATAREVYIKRSFKSRTKRKATLDSLKKNKPELLEELDCLRKTNNLVKHKGKCQYREKGKVIKVDSTRTWQFINAVEEAIEYTKSLAPS